MKDMSIFIQEFCANVFNLSCVCIYVIRLLRIHYTVDLIKEQRNTILNPPPKKTPANTSTKNKT